MRFEINSISVDFRTPSHSRAYVDIEDFGSAHIELTLTQEQQEQLRQSATAQINRRAALCQINNRGGNNA
jgi:hypothetical protein